MNASIPKRNEPVTPPDRKQAKHAEGRQRSQPTHFLALPLSSPLRSSDPSSTATRAQLRSSLDAFTHTVSPNIIPPEAIRPPGVVHFTCGVMALHTREEVEDAMTALNSLTLNDLVRRAAATTPEEAGDGKTPAARREGSSVVASESQEEPAVAKDEAGFVIDLVGLHPLPPLRLGAHRGEARVLYATARPAGTVTKFARAVWCAFESARRRTSSVAGDVAGGQAVGDDGGQQAVELKRGQGAKEREFLLHATLVNTIYVRPRHHNGHLRARAGPRGKRGGKFMIPITTTSDNAAFCADATTTSDNVVASTAAAAPAAAPSEAVIDASEEGGRNYLNLLSYRDHVWAEGVKVDRVALCKMGASRVDGSELVYEELASLPIPSLIPFGTVHGGEK